ncbi:hypothetical protein [Marinagarivorans cellulosilyticus]|uniref:hypothetical protein n=1 Tax=Marinagarivorans cellulosilyticus TaxID=2721545 RepID=UPI001F33C880|nr:hypothetical protein [Marinagarivorans cellulosilyticus]
MRILTKNGCTFFLQNNFFSEEFAKKLMLQLIVKNIDEAYVTASNLANNDTNCRSNIKFSDVKEESWGSVFYLWGASGELWHITELRGE